MCDRAESFCLYQMYMTPRHKDSDIGYRKIMYTRHEISLHILSYKIYTRYIWTYIYYPRPRIHMCTYRNRLCCMSLYVTETYNKAYFYMLFQTGRAYQYTYIHICIHFRNTHYLDMCTHVYAHNIHTHIHLNIHTHVQRLYVYLCVCVCAWTSVRRTRTEAIQGGASIHVYTYT